MTDKTDREIMQQALNDLEALVAYIKGGETDLFMQVPSIEALRERLAQPEQEPVAWHEPDSFGNVTTYKKWALENGWKPLYTAPPKREWQRLTDDEIDAIDKSIPDGTDFKAAKRVFARAIEDKLKEKNARND